MSDAFVIFSCGFCFGMFVMLLLIATIMEFTKEN